MEVRVKVKVVRKRTGKGYESYMVYIPKLIYKALGEPEEIEWVLTENGLRVETP